jgi:hypothetical protein
MAVALTGMTLYTNNDNEAGWGGTDGPDTYNNAIQGTNAESWNCAKNSTETGTLTLTPGTAPGTSRSLFMFWMSSNLAPYYTAIDLELQSSASNYKNFEVANSTNKEIGGDFTATVVDYVNKGTSTGTYAPASHTVLRIIIDNSSSGNIRSVINNWVDVMYFGPGHTISGTTTGDALFAEAAAIDITDDDYYGILEDYNGIIYSQGDLDLSGTALTSDSEVLVFKDTVNGYDTYNFDITGTVTFTNTAVIAAGTIDYIFDSTGATAFTQTGGSHVGYSSFLTKAGQTMSGIVFQNGGTGTIVNTISNSTYNSCGLVTLSVAGELNGCTFNNTAATSYAVSVPNLNDIPDCVFRDSTNTTHCCILTGAFGSYTWSGLDPDSDYDVGTASGASTDVAVTGGSITGNEHIYLSDSNVANAYTINVATGAVTPSVATAGCIAYVVANQRTVTFTVNPAITGYEWRFYQVTALGSLAGASALVTGEESAAASTQTDFYSYTYAAGLHTCLQILSDTYEESLTYLTLPDQDTVLTINLTVDNND